VQIAHQSFGLLSLLTAAENIELAAQGLPKARRPDRRALRTAAGNALDSVGLAARADHLVDELSGGEQQRIALARAISTEPDLMLADEPTAQLDAENRARVTDLLLDLARKGATVIVATHDRELTERCDLEFTLRDGLLR
jgi:ABC-type lipoprotein export system ATPase subunit